MSGKLTQPTYKYYARGAGIYNNGGKVTIASGCSVSNNVINADASTLCYGGGIYNTQGGTLIVNGTVSNNTVYDDLGGGGIWNDGGTVIVNGTVSGNKSRGGGGIANSPNGKLTINTTGIVKNNSAAKLDSIWKGMGGGIYNSGELTVRGTITNNNSDGEGGGIYTNTTITVQGGKIYGNTPDDCAGSGCPSINICSIPPYSPAYWNDGGTIQSTNNCYNYANNKSTNTFAQPGKAAGAQFTQLKCSAVYTAAKADGLEPLPTSGICPDTKAKVALVVAPDWDYHWYRLDSGRMWSHKPGQTKATNLDNAGKPIANPETADRGGYTDFCGYFCVCSDQQQGQGHENIQ